MEFIKKVALILVIIGALNWLLVGLFEIDLVASLFGSTTAMLSKLIYIIIGLSGLVSITYFFDRD